MNIKDLQEKLLDATARIEQIVCIAGAMGDGEEFSAPLQELLEEDDETLRQCFGEQVDSLLELIADDVIVECFKDWALHNNKLGFAVQFAAPIFRRATTGSMGSYSWGCYSTRWVYGDTFDAAVSAGLAWVAEQVSIEA